VSFGPLGILIVGPIYLAVLIGIAGLYFLVFSVQLILKLTVVILEAWQTRPAKSKSAPLSGRTPARENQRTGRLKERLSSPGLPVVAPSDLVRLSVTTPTAADRPGQEVVDNYDTKTCELFASSLGDDVLRRASIFFEALATEKKFSSLRVVELIHASSARSIPGLLTTPLKRRAHELGLPLPFAGGKGALAYGGIPDPDPDKTTLAERTGRTQAASRHESRLP
jgi:hypothetical protein